MTAPAVARRREHALQRLREATAVQVSQHAAARALELGFHEADVLSCQVRMLVAQKIADQLRSDLDLGVDHPSNRSQAAAAKTSRTVPQLNTGWGKSGSVIGLGHPIAPTTVWEILTAAGIDPSSEWYHVGLAVSEVNVLPMAAPLLVVTRDYCVAMACDAIRNRSL